MRKEMLMFSVFLPKKMGNRKEEKKGMAERCITHGARQYALFFFGPYNQTLKEQKHKP